MTAPFVRIVRAGWPESIYAEAFVGAEREVIEEWESDSNSPDEWARDMEDIARQVTQRIQERGLILGPWTDIGPCVKEAQIAQ